MRRVPGRYVGWAAIAALSTYALFVGGTWAPTYFVSYRVVTLILAAASLGVWVIVAVHDHEWRPRSTLEPAFAAAFTVFTISTLTSRYPRFGFEYLAWSILLAALYFLLVRLMASSFFRPRILGFSLISATVIGIAYTILVGADWVIWWGMIGRLAAPPLRPGLEGLTFGNPNPVMVASVLLTAPVVAHIWGSGRSRRGLALALVGLTAVVSLLTGSRAGWLAVAAAIVVVGSLPLLSAEHRHELVSVARSRTAQLIAILVAIVGAVTATVAGPGLLQRVGAGGEDLRTAFFAASLRMFESAPLVGVGPGTWAMLRAPFTLAGEPDYYIPHAHSIYLETLAEFGLLGVAAALVVALVLGRLVLGAVRDQDPARRRMGWAVLFISVYFLVHQSFDFYVHSPALLFAFVIPIALLDATAPLERRRWLHLPTAAALTARIRVAAGSAGVAAVIAAIAFLAWSERGALLMQDGTARLNTFDPSAAVPPLAAAVRTDTAMPPYHLALGLALANTGDLVGAEPHLLESALVDDLPETWLDLAAVRARLGDPSGTDDALARAMRLGEQQSAVALGAGVIELELGRPIAARVAFAKSLLLSPSLAGDPWWTAESARGAIWGDVYAQAFERASSPQRFALAIEKGDIDAVNEAIAATRDQNFTKSHQLILAAWSGDQGALAQLEALAREKPLDSVVVNWLARINHHLGNEARATFYKDWTFIVNGQGIDAAEIRVATHPVEENVAGTASVFHGHYAYRRPIPHIQLVSWLPQLVFE